MTRLRLRLLMAMSLTAAALPAAFAACGARTGLPVWDVEDEPDEPDATLDATLDAEPDGDADADAAEPEAGDDAPMDAPPDNMSVRRPFLVGASLRKANLAKRGDWTDTMPAAPDLDPRTRALLARAWADDGCDEHASIGAFSRFTLLLLAVGAPPEFVVASQAASLDEVRHARACFSLAARYGAGDVGPGALAVDDCLGNTLLPRVAALAVQEGCVGETVGVALVRAALAGARDEAVVAVQRRILRDESKHAELAWRFARWAYLSGTDSVRRAMERSFDEAIEATRRAEILDYGVDGEAWRAHGRLACPEARAIIERAVREVVRPCAAALFSAPAGLGARAPGALVG